MYIYLFTFHLYLFIRKDLALLRTDYNVQQRHNNTPMHPFVRGFDQTSSLSASVPSDSFDNFVASRSVTCWGSLNDNKRSENLTNSKKSTRKGNNELNNHHQQKIKKTNLIKFYEKKSAELVAHTIDKAANRCRIHMLWQIFRIQSDYKVNNYYVNC